MLTHFNKKIILTIAILKWYILMKYVDLQMWLCCISCSWEDKCKHFLFFFFSFFAGRRGSRGTPPPPSPFTPSLVVFSWLKQMCFLYALFCCSSTILYHLPSTIFWLRFRDHASFTGQGQSEYSFWKLLVQFTQCVGMAKNIYIYLFFFFFFFVCVRVWNAYWEKWHCLFCWFLHCMQ